MKNLASFLILLIAFSNCSFDKKTGIWKDAAEERKIKKEDARKAKLEDIFVENRIFEEEKEVSYGTKIEFEKPLKNKNWKDRYFSSNNNTPNIYYKNNKYLVFKSSKLSKYFTDADFLFYNDNIISSDNKGRIYIYSLKQEKKIFEYYFYKKKFKKYKKEINITVENGKIYVSDNLGYIYAIEISSGKLIWAKHLGIPFRSNLKVIDDQIFLVDQDNRIYCLKSSNGEKLWQFSTGLTRLKSNFKNNLAVDEENKNVYFLNTSGELYSINYLDQGVNWFLNLKNNRRGQSNDSELFLGSPLLLKDNSIIVSAGNSLSSYDSLSGSTIWKKNITANTKGVVTKNNIFLFTNNNLLICLDFYTGEIIWSKNIFNQIKPLNKGKFFKKIKKISNLTVVNNEIFLFSSKGYLLSFNSKNGKINSVNRILKSGLGNRPIFANGYMYLFDKNYKLFKYN